MESLLRSMLHSAKELPPSFITNLVPSPLRKRILEITDEKFSELQRLRSLPPRKETTTNLLGPPTRITDAATFIGDYNAIFEEEIYAFEPEKQAPRIIDGGANIGLATLYWKRRFPEAQITAFEPGPRAFQALKFNVESRGLRKVEPVRKGLWKHDDGAIFEADGEDGGHFSQFPVEREVVDTQETQTACLSHYLKDKKVDMLKLDIEGAEVEVLLEAQNHLDKVQNLFVEYHSYIGKEQRLDEIITVLRKNNFRFYLYPESEENQPFLGVRTQNGMDHNIRIYAFK